VAARRRAVERAARRRSAIDRVVAGSLAVVAAAGLMSVLPGSTQRAVSRASCQVATLGLATCGDPGLDLTDTALGPPRCLLLADLDSALPEVRVRRLVAAQDLVVTISTARSGDVVVQLGDEPQPGAPAVLDGGVRGQRRVAEGVSVPAQAEWFLPRGQGLDELVGAVQDARHQVVQDRSALGLLGAALDRGERSVPAPTQRYAQVDLTQPVWPRAEAARPAPPRSGTAPARPAVPPRSGSQVAVATDRPAQLVFNRISRESSTVVPLAGSLGGQPATGTLRVTRDGAGTVVSVLVGVVTPARAVPGETAAASAGPAVAYVQVPVRTEPERALVASWLAGSGPVVVPLDGLLGLRAPQADDRLDSFLTRAATVTVLRYGGVGTARLSDRVAEELRTGRREDWAGVRLVGAGRVEPTSSGAGRRLVPDPACRT
jgi:hypothetical protein